MSSAQRRGALGSVAALILALASVSAMSGCGSDANQTENSRMAGAELKGMFARFFHRGQASSAPGIDTETMARTALENNTGPLILVSFEGQGLTTILGMSGENGAMRTYATANSQALILRGGILAGSRGFGYDIMSGETAALGALVRGRSAGEADYTLRYLDGLGQERPLPLHCVTQPGEQASYPFLGQTWTGTQMVAHCEGYGATIDNSFIVSGEGAILASRQWMGPQLGYATIQTVRP
jgi:hypothetical protein